MSLLERPAPVAQEQALRQSYYVEHLPLNSGETVEVSLRDAPLRDAADMLAETGIEGPMVALIHAGESSYGVVDVRGIPDAGTLAFLILSNEFEMSNSPKEAVAVTAGQSVAMGRGRYEDAFVSARLDDALSRDHFTVTSRGDKLFITDNESSNGTEITGRLAGSRRVADGRVNAEYTNYLKAYLTGRREYSKPNRRAPYGSFKGYPLIGRDSTSVREGLYGTRTGESILVDADSSALQAVAANFIAQLPPDQISNTRSLLAQVNEYTARVLRYSGDEADQVTDWFEDSDNIVPLSKYVESGVGVCRHQSLIVAHIVEELIANKNIDGQIGVERNHDLDEESGHAWAVYKRKGSEDIIVDATQGFTGTREEAKRYGLWKYDLGEPAPKRRRLFFR